MVVKKNAGVERAEEKNDVHRGNINPERFGWTAA
jgi:hypothetical protein